MKNNKLRLVFTHLLTALLAVAITLGAVLIFSTNSPNKLANLQALIDEVFIGLNDLSLGYGFNFMFKPLADGTVDKIIEKFKAKKLPYGFGGVASLGRGALPGEKVIAEHYRLGSTCVILSRSFCNTRIGCFFS